MEILLLLVWVGWSVVLLMLYHSIFHVVYFSLANGLLKEVIVAGFIGAILTALTITYWWILLIVAVIVILIKCKMHS